jgi:subtilisin family serine protease
MKKIFILMVCLVAIGFTAEMIPAHIPASAIHKEVLPATKYIEAECVYTGVTNYPPWFDYGRDAPWTTDVRINDWYDRDDVLTSMAEDALGRIYVCYETVNDDANYCWGLATSIDNGVTWDNRTIEVANPSYYVRYPEISITDDGKIYIFGSVTGGTWNNCPCYMRSHIGGYNDPDDLYGFSLWDIPDRTYAECVTWGNGNQFVSTQYTVDHSGTDNDSVCVLFSHDSISGGFISYITFRPWSSGSYPGKTSLGLDVTSSGDTIWTHGIEYYDAAGSDWDVVCYLDTLSGSGLYGWGTGNTNDDRYPSVFASQGYAYIAYQADVGSSDNDIMYSYSADYGENWASIVDLTNDASNETYPRLYGDDQTIGINYLYRDNRIRFNYSLDNGITWLNTPEQINEGTTVNPGYHSVSLLYISGYWHAAWEDTRNLGTDGLEIYASGRNAGQGDITHRPAVVFFNYDWSFLGDISSEKYVLYHSENPIGEKLTEVIAKSSPDEQIRVFVMMAKQLNYDWLIPRAEQMSKSDRRQFVIDECKALAQEDQQLLLAYLHQIEQTGKASDVLSLWVTNTVAFKAYPEIIQEIGQRSDIWYIAYEEKVQIIGAVDDQRSVYEHVEFIPEDGREICWGVAKINADDVWGDYTGAGVIVGHMDTGVNYNHNDLQDHMWDGGVSYPNHGYDFVNEDDDPMDGNGHGTATAGIVAGDGTSGSKTGVAPDAQIMALKCDGFASDMAEAIQFGFDNGAHLFSTSLGFEDPDNSIKNWGRGWAIAIYGAGCVWSCAAGNGRSVPPYGHYTVPQDIICPADCPSPYYAPNGGNSASIAVGATDIGDDIASWSSYGPTHWDNTGTYDDYPYPPGLMKPDVAAPGVDCKSLDYADNSGYVSGINGTSFSQPHLAGTIALMLEKESGLLPKQLDSIIQNYGVIDIEAVGRDNLSGEGRIDALMAVNAISAGYRSKTFRVINQASATGMLQVTDITQEENEPWIIGITPTEFNVPIDDSVFVTIMVDTTGLGYLQGSYHYDTVLVWSNTVFDDNPERVPVILLMATIGIEEDGELTPKENANFLSMLPNPFRTSVQIDYTVPYAQDVNFTIYDVCGQKVKTFIDGHQEAGQFSVRWTGCDDKGRKLAAGIYFGRIEVGKHAVTNKLILIR